MHNQGKEQPRQIKVWDIVVRSFHWSLVTLFTLDYISGDGFDWLHALFGYGILILLAVRLLWGLAGTKYARFSNFIHGRRTVKDYALSLLSGRAPHYLGHNPLGGWMIMALLVCLFFTSWSGLEAYGAKGHGPLAQGAGAIIQTARGDEGTNDNGDTGLWGGLHEALANLTLFLVLMHIAGVLVSSLLQKENLVRAMWTGYKRQRPEDDAPD